MNPVEEGDTATECEDEIISSNNDEEDTSVSY